MTQTYRARRRGQDAPAAQKFQTSVPGPSMQELAAGAMPSAEQMGRRVDLPGAIREKMEASFGADFSGVKLYESQTVADAGANAMTMGSSVAFAPGQLDLSSTSGQALLGHELSHVVSQAKGESTGKGFLADSGLEAQADRQGAMAARGENVYSGPVTPLSASAVPASAAGPMQASKDEDSARENLKKGRSEKRENRSAFYKALSRYQSPVGASYVAVPGHKWNYLQSSMAGFNQKTQDRLVKAAIEGDEDTFNAHLLDRFRKEFSDTGFQKKVDDRLYDSEHPRRKMDAYGKYQQRIRQRRDLAKAMRHSGKLGEWLQNGDLGEGITAEDFKEFYDNTKTDRKKVHEVHKLMRTILPRKKKKDFDRDETIDDYVRSDFGHSTADNDDE